LQKKNIAFFLLLIFALSAAACGNSANKSGGIYNSPQSDEIHIGIAYPAELRDKDTYFIKGVELAVNSINAKGGVIGKTLHTVIKDDHNDTHIAMQIANTFIEQGITAVIGHWSTNICYFLEDIYEANNVVMITPAATGSILFEYDYQYIFRMIANVRIFAEAIAGYMSKTGLRRTAIFYSDDEYGADFSAVLEDELSKRNITVIDRVTNITQINISFIIDRWRAFGCDSVIIAAASQDMIEPIQLIYEANGNLPFLGADDFDRTTLADSLGSSANALYMASKPFERLDSVFLSAFRAAYGHDPNIQAITGYMSVYMLKDAMEAVGSTDSTLIAGYLSSIENHDTILGPMTYNSDTQEFDGHVVAVRKLSP